MPPAPAPVRERVFFFERVEEDVDDYICCIHGMCVYVSLFLSLCSKKKGSENTAKKKGSKMFKKNECLLAIDRG